MTPVGFEPTHLAIVELESTPLDHSGKVSCSEKARNASAIATAPCTQIDMHAAIAQLGERQTEDLKVPGSIPGLGNFYTLNDL